MVKGHSPYYFDQASCDLDAFKRVCAQQLDPANVPHALEIHDNIPLYDIRALTPLLADKAQRAKLLSEWGWVLGQSSGVLVFKSAYADLGVIDRATRIFQDIIADEKQKNNAKGDHFSKAGMNDRIWNALQKQCLRDPEGFALYYSNTGIQAVAEAWLGPYYQLTAQVNQVRPGGQAQAAHRDYHLGFQDMDHALNYPKPVHAISSKLTLQGGIAHCDMPVASGPTKLLPFSQAYDAGYVAFHQQDHRDYFEKNCVQLPLAKGDMLFFNPALFHAAGENKTTEIERMANLLQISSAFGRAMEAVDRKAISAALFPILMDCRKTGRLEADEIDAVIAAAAEGYAFPTNLDSNPPIGNKPPLSQADIFRTALAEDWTAAAFNAALDSLSDRAKP